MKQADNDYVIVGKIGSSYGVKGWVKVFSFTEEMTTILNFDPWYLEEAGQWKPIELLEGREHGKLLIVKLAGFDTPEHVRILTGKKIAVLRSQLPTLKKGEYYWRDLEGLTVIDQKGETLGTVLYVLATGANDVLIIKDAKEKEHAIPYLPGKVITKVDLEQRQIQVDWELI